MDVDRLLPAERVVQQIVFRRARKVLVAAHDVRDAHRVVVDDVCEVIGRHAVRLDQDHVVQIGAVHCDVPVQNVVERRFAVLRHVLPDDVRLAGRDAALHFLGGKVQAVLVVLERLAALLRFLAAGAQLLLGAEAVIRLAGLHELLGVGQIHVLALALYVRTIVAADVGTFVPLHADAFQRAVDHVDRAGHVAALIGILDAEDELSAVRSGVQVRVQRAAEVSEVHIARRGRGKSGSDFHHILLTKS